MQRKGTVRVLMSNLSIDTDPQQQEAASPLMLVVRSFLRTVATSMKNLVLGAQLVVVYTLSAVSVCYSATSYDGRWKGEGRLTTECPDKADLTFAIQEGE